MCVNNTLLAVKGSPPGYHSLKNTEFLVPSRVYYWLLHLYENKLCIVTNKNFVEFFVYSLNYQITLYFLSLLSLHFINLLIFSYFVGFTLLYVKIFHKSCLLLYMSTSLIYYCEM